MLLSPQETIFAQAVANLALANPFEPEEVEKHVRVASAADLSAEVKRRFGPLQPVWDRKEIPLLLRAADALIEDVRERLRTEKGGDEERALYRDMLLFVLYFRFRGRLEETIRQCLEAPPEQKQGRRAGTRVPYFEDFARSLQHFMAPAGGVSASLTAHWFAGFFQVRRAFTQIDMQIVGASKPIARLRAAVWQSIFTHDMRRYRDILFERMHDIATLITGPSGTGKDLVAAAIGLSRYVAFNARSLQFVEDFGGAFHPVNLSALAPQLIESELFGHCQGAFTGAVKGRIGWLESCRRWHTVFLDEIGELAPPLQVKLLRVLQNRTFQRLGETEPRRFEGKVIAATNRDLGELTGAGEFRRDFYYRICSDRIHTPSLSEQLRDDRAELSRLVTFLSRRIVGDACDGVAKEVVTWIEAHLGPDYAWPGNIRELEQCVRNILVRREYVPLQHAHASTREAFLRRVSEVEVSAKELLDWYCQAAHEKAGNYVDAAARIGLDRRTLRRRVRN